MKTLSLFFTLILFGSTGFCDSFMNLGKKITLEDLVSFNEETYFKVQRKKFSFLESKGYSPFNEDLQEVGYIVLSDKTLFGSQVTKEKILKSLPKSIVPIVFVTDKESRSKLFLWKKLNPRLITVTSLYRVDDFFWSRDSLPMPLFNGKDLKVVESKYFYKKNILNIDFLNYNDSNYNPFYFEGGNLISTPQGDCFTISNKYNKLIPDFVFKKIYGCHQITRLPHLHGIGHIDERVRFLSANEVITDTAPYVSLLKEKGLKVNLLPVKNKNDYSYLNFIKLGRTILLPFYSSKQDKKVARYLKNKGFKIIPIDSFYLSLGHGSIHCISQTYPKVQLYTLLNLLNAQEIELEPMYSEYLSYNEEY